MTRRKLHVPPLDSPSKQLIHDLAEELEKVYIFNSELKKVHAYERKAFCENLDRIDQEREAAHTAALDKAAAFHDQVREEAEATLRQYLLEEEEERRRKEEEDRKEKERIEFEKAERLRRQQEEAARVQAERKAKEEAKRKADEEAERSRRAAQAEKEREERQQRERVEAEKRKQAEETKKAQEQAEQQARAQQQQKAAGGQLTPEEIRVQDRYVEVHKVLKDMRKWLQGVGKQQPAIKQAMGDMRRTIKKCVGQLRDGKGTNKQQVSSRFCSHFHLSSDDRAIANMIFSISDPADSCRAREGFDVS